MPPKTILAKFQFLTQKNPAIENSPKNPSIIPETWNSEYPPPPPLPGSVSTLYWNFFISSSYLYPQYFVCGQMHQAK